MTKSASRLRLALLRDGPRKLITIIGYLPCSANILLLYGAEAVRLRPFNWSFPTIYRGRPSLEMILNPAQTSEQASKQAPKHSRLLRYAISLSLYPHGSVVISKDKRAPRTKAHSNLGEGAS